MQQNHEKTLLDMRKSTVSDLQILAKALLELPHILAQQGFKVQIKKKTRKPLLNK